MRMFRKFSQVFFSFIFILSVQILVQNNALAAEASPVGVWKTIDDKTNKPRSIVQIWQQGDELRGRILKIFFRPGESAKDVCLECKGASHNQPILGMTIIWGMTKQSERWEGGRILDPKNGKIYRCLLTLSSDNQQLNVRGYIGVTLFGRTQTWFRQANAAIEQQ